MKKVLISGYFDPLHKGHLDYIKQSKELGDYLVVAVNSDESAIRKKGHYFMPVEDRIKIIKALKNVDEVIKAIDKDDSVAETIKFVKPNIFAKGGDRNISNLPIKEIEACKEVGAEIVTGLGEKIESSSHLIERENFFKDKNIRCDLHVHSNCSDGGLDAKSLIEKAKQNEIKILSITDHNNIDIYRQLQSVDCTGLLIINGFECDVEFNGKNLHILMYGFNPDNNYVNQFFENFRKDDIKNFEEMIDKVCQNYSLKISREDIAYFEKENCYFDKVRLNNFLTQLKLANSPKDAYYQFTKDILDKQRRSVPANDLFTLAKQCGAVTILAHPMKYVDNDFDLDNLKELMLELNKIGLDGIEVFNNRQTLENQEELYKFAINHNMEYSAGSDMHSKIGLQEKKEMGKILGQNITLKMFSPALIKVFESKYKNK